MTIPEFTNPARLASAHESTAWGQRIHIQHTGSRTISGWQTACFHHGTTTTELPARHRPDPKSIWHLPDAVWIGFRVVRPLEAPDLETRHFYWNTGPGPGSDQ